MIRVAWFKEQWESLIAGMESDIVVNMISRS